MVAVTGMLVGGIAIVGVFLLLALRRWTLAETRMDALLRSPGAPTVAYRVPDAQDPVVLMVALRRFGFVSVVDTGDGAERLLVACAAQERAQVRRIIEEVHSGGLDGPEMHVPHVRFEDETEAS